MFPGQYFDEETGLHYNYFRDYDLSTERYIESDPEGINGGLNSYNYAFQNPMVFVDPNGGSPIRFGEILSFGFSFSVSLPRIAPGIGVGGGTGFTVRKCCAEDGLIHNEIFVTARMGVAFGTPTSFSVAPTGRGNIGLARFGRLPECLMFNETLDNRSARFIDFTAFGISGNLDLFTGKFVVGASGSVGASATFNIFQRDILIERSPPISDCPCK